MLTVSKLKENIRYGWSKDSIIIVGQNSNGNGVNILGLQSLSNGNLYMSLTPKVGNCEICGHAVYEHEIDSRQSYCPNCNKSYLKKK